MKKMILCSFAVLALITLSACNTVEGFGKDVKHVGQSMENSAAKHADK